MKSTLISKVVLNRRAYEDLVIYASRYASPFIDPEDQREVYGILVGHVDDVEKIIYVRQTIGIVVGSRTGVEFESKEYVDLSHIDESIYNKSMEYEKGDFICGWWHTHPGFGFFYSQTDTLNHIGFQAANPYAIGIIYDYKQRKTELKDPGIEILTLDKPQPLHASTETVNFEIHDLGQALVNLDHILEEKVKTIYAAKKRIEYVKNVMEHKKFAQLQRNYGLLLIKKHDAKKSQKELKAMSEEDRFIYEWNEADIKDKYTIPKFREQTEKKIADYKKHKDKRGIGQKQLEESLLKPKKIIQNLYQEYNQLLEEIQPVRRWLDAEERLTLMNFNFKLAQYIKSLNALITKTYYLIPHQYQLDKNLFDETVLNKIVYGDEEETMLDIQASKSVEVSSNTTLPITSQAIADQLSGWDTETTLNNPQIIADKTQIKEPPKEIKESQFSESNEPQVKEFKKTEISTPNLEPAIIPSKKEKGTKTFTKTPLKVNADPELDDLPPTIDNPEPILKESITSFKKETPTIESTLENAQSIKVNVIKPIQIDFKPIKITDTKSKFEINLDEIFDDESQLSDGWGTPKKKKT